MTITAKCRSVCRTIVFVVLALSASRSFAQLPFSTSPAQWLYPRGNAEATLSQKNLGGPQSPDSLSLKWSSNAIAGDVHPLVANIINNLKLVPTYPFAPLEISAVIAGQLVTIDATGRTKTITRLPSFVRSISVALDSSCIPLELYKKYPAILGLETIERRDTTDSLALGYLAAYDTTADTISILKRLTIDVRPFAPNLFASIKPIFGRSVSNQLVVHAIVNMSSPTIPSPPSSLPYFRGLTSFSCGQFGRGFLSTVSDTLPARFTVGPSVSFTQPSITDLGSGLFDCVLPCQPTSLDWNVPDSFRPAINTYANRPYLFGVTLVGSTASEGIIPVDLSPYTTTGQTSSRPRIETFHLTLSDAGGTATPTSYVLVAEEYMGRDSSDGNARLHLYNTIGDPITFPADSVNPSFLGRHNHSWAIATGDVDGRDTNELLPYYPHNPGDEIIATQTTHEFAFPASRLMVLRYRSGTRIQKPAPRNAYLYPLDTIVTTPMTGWVACVSDLDNNGDYKSEIFIADGSELYVLRMRDYADARFTEAAPFDTVFHSSFPTENINHVAVADVDGDGYNDVIVTTNVKTYLFGLPSKNSLFIIDPARSLKSSPSICEGDSATVSWYNVFKGQPAVTLRFQEYRNGNPADSARIINSSVSNNSDTVHYSFIPDSSYASKTGRFVVISNSRPDIRDSSALVNFYAPFIKFDSISAANVYTAQQYQAVTGTLHCLDSAQLFCSVDAGKTWIAQKAVYRRSSDTSFWFSLLVPCPNFFGCTIDSDSLLWLRAEGLGTGTRRRVYSDTITARVVPQSLYTKIYPEPDVMCSERTILWNLPADTSICDSVSLLISENKGKTFRQVAQLPRAQREYIYHPDVQSADTIIFRICCAQTCLRTDTTFYNAKAKLIRSIAPNPFDPSTERCDIFSVPPVNSTATIRIFDQNEHVLAEIVKGESREAGKVYCDHWDGSTDDGKTVSMGMYYVVIEYSDGSKEFYPVFVRKR